MWKNKITILICLKKKKKENLWKRVKTKALSLATLLMLNIFKSGRVSFSPFTPPHMKELPQLKASLKFDSALFTFDILRGTQS